MAAGLVQLETGPDDLFCKNPQRKNFNDFINWIQIISLLPVQIRSQNFEIALFMAAPEFWRIKVKLASFLNTLLNSDEKSYFFLIRIRSKKYVLFFGTLLKSLVIFLNRSGYVDFGKIGITWDEVGITIPLERDDTFLVRNDYRIL